MPIQINGRTLREAVLGRDSYGLLFVLLMVDYVTLTVVNSGSWGGLLRTVPVALTVLLAIHTSDGHRGMLRFAQVVAVISVVVGTVQAVTGIPKAAAVDFLLVALLLLVSPLVILRRILPKETVDLETLFAAVDVYIMIGLIFGTIFIALAHIEPGTKPFLAQPGFHPSSDYIYLSFVTLTTVGFGDLTPYTEVARSVVVLEALIGQIFLVTLVARLVALYSTENRERQRILSRRPSERQGGGRLRRRRQAGGGTTGDPGGDDLPAAGDDPGDVEGGTLGTDPGEGDGQ